MEELCHDGMGSLWSVSSGLGADGYTDGRLGR